MIKKRPNSMEASRLAIVARDIMSTDVFVFHPEDDIPYAAKSLVERGISGAPVVDDDGKLIGLVSDGDLIIQDATVHYPTYYRLLDSFITLGKRHFEEVLKKVTAIKLADLMTTEVVTALETATVEELATKMHDLNISRIPIVDDSGRPVGLVTKTDIVRSMAATWGR